jgi:hypothetical protein
MSLQKRWADGRAVNVTVWVSFPIAYFGVDEGARRARVLRTEGLGVHLPASSIVMWYVTFV